MTDAEYLFQQRSRELKRISYGARAKKNGSKSKSCKLGTDFMTAAQKKKMNGECKVYQLKRPMTWKQFMAMPNDLQAEYILYLQSKKARKCDIADMFGCKHASFDSYLYAHHKGKFHFQKGKNEMDPDWMDFLTCPDGGGERGKERRAERNRTGKEVPGSGAAHRNCFIRRKTGRCLPRCAEAPRHREGIRDHDFLPKV